MHQFSPRFVRKDYENMVFERIEYIKYVTKYVKKYATKQFF